MVVFNWSSKCRLNQGPSHIVLLHGKVYELGELVREQSDERRFDKLRISVLIFFALESCGGFPFFTCKSESEVM